MSRYIRTKDTVSKVETNLSSKELYNYLIQFDNYKNNLIKVADTIEELCDGFYYDNETEVFIMRFYHYNKNADCFNCDEDGYYILLRKEFSSYGHNLYGFIKTDKGLIYVAKMNEKGEMELL